MVWYIPVVESKHACTSAIVHYSACMRKGFSHAPLQCDVGCSETWLRCNLMHACRRAMRPASFLAVGDVLLLAALLFMHCRMVLKYVPVLGWWVVVLGPGFGWAPHFAAALLVQGYLYMRR